MYSEVWNAVTYSVSVFRGRGNILTKLIGNDFTIGHLVPYNLNTEDPYINVWLEYNLTRWLRRNDEELFGEAYGRTVCLHIRKKLKPRIGWRDVFRFKRFGIFLPENSEDYFIIRKREILEEILIAEEEKMRKEKLRRYRQ